MASTITESSYKSDTEIGIGTEKIKPRPLSLEVDRDWLYLKFGTEVEKFTENEESKGASYDSRKHYRRYIYGCLWLLSKKRRAVILDQIAAKDLNYLKNELTIRHQRYPNMMIRVFAAFLSFVTGKPPLIKLGKFGTKGGKGISGPKGIFATLEDIKRIDQKYDEKLSRFAESEESSGIAASTVKNHRRHICACISVLENSGITVPDGVTKADIEFLREDLKKKEVVDRSKIPAPFSEFLAFFGNPCGGSKTKHYGTTYNDWKTPYRRGFRFSDELEEYRRYIRNRGIEESYIAVKISRIVICGRILDKLCGDKPLNEIDIRMTEDLESFILQHATEDVTRQYINSFFEFAGYFGVPNYYTELVNSRRTHITFNPKNEGDEKFLVQLQG